MINQPIGIYSRYKFVSVLRSVGLVIGHRGFDVKMTYGKSCAPNFGLVHI